MEQLNLVLPKSTLFPSCRKIAVLQGEPTTSSIIEIIEKKRHAVVEGKRSLKSDFVKNYLIQKERVDFFLCLTARSAYRVEISMVLEKFFSQEDFLNPLDVKTIIAVVQEAFSNAFLWSCLELPAEVKADKELAWGKHISNQLKKDSFGRRLLALEVIRDLDKVKIKIYGQGKPIYWDLNPIKKKENLSGTALIKTLADQVHICHKGDQIHLVFDVTE